MIRIVYRSYLLANQHWLLCQIRWSSDCENIHKCTMKVRHLTRFCELKAQINNLDNVSHIFRIRHEKVWT